MRCKNSNGEIISSHATNEGYPYTFEIAKRLKVDQDWQTYKIEFTPPEGTATVEIGLVIGSYTMKDCPDLMYTWDNIVFMETEKYKEYDESTDLLFKLTEKGNANLDADGTVDVLDLVKMKKYVADTTLITDVVLENADMNVNKIINNADIELLHWKLLGVDTEAKAASVQGYRF